MDPIAILKVEHRLLAGSMAVIATAEGEPKLRLVQKFKRQVEIHNQIENDVFYAAMGARLKPPAGQMNHEARHVVSKSLTMLVVHPVDAPDWVPYFNATRNLFVRHMENEERTAFVKARNVMNRWELHQVGAKILAEKIRLETLERPLDADAGIVGKDASKGPLVRTKSSR